MLEEINNKDNSKHQLNRMYKNKEKSKPEKLCWNDAIKNCYQEWSKIRKEEVKIELRMKAVTTVSTDDKGMAFEHYKQS